LTIKVVKRVLILTKHIVINNVHLGVTFGTRCIKVQVTDNRRTYNSNEQISQFDSSPSIQNDTWSRRQGHKTDAQRRVLVLI